MRSNKTVLILGGGVGGVVAATRLRRLLNSNDRVVLIEREEHHVFQPSLLWLAVDKRRPDQIQRPVEHLTRKGIEVILGEITQIQPDEKRIRVGNTELSGDAVVISLGVELAPDLVPGLSSAGHNLYTLSGAAAAADDLRGLRSGRVVVLTAAPAYKCPAAPYEAAMLIRDFLRRRGSDTRSSVEIYAAEAGPMGTAGPNVSKAVRAMVEAHDVGYHPNHQLEAVDSASQSLRFADGTTAAFDHLLFVPPHRAPAVVRNAGLTDGSGWIPVDSETMETGFPGVYAIGDVTSIPLPSGKSLPKAGVFAHAQAEVVAANIAGEWSGREPERVFDGKGGCFIETGRGRAGYGSGDFFAEPVPSMRLHRPARWWHWGKVLFEQRWLHKWF